MSSAEPGGSTASPVDCGICNHSGRYTQCPGCGGLIGMGKWPPCTFCQAVIGVVDPQPPGPMPMMSTIHGQIEATEPRTLPPLEAFAAEAATGVHGTSAGGMEALRVDVQELTEEIGYMREVLREMSQRVTNLTQAVLGRNA